MKSKMPTQTAISILRRGFEALAESHPSLEFFAIEISRNLYSIRLDGHRRSNWLKQHLLDCLEIDTAQPFPWVGLRSQTDSSPESFAIFGFYDGLSREHPTVSSSPLASFVNCDLIVPFRSPRNEAAIGQFAELCDIAWQHFPLKRCSFTTGFRCEAIAFAYEDGSRVGSTLIQPHFWYSHLIATLGINRSSKSVSFENGTATFRLHTLPSPVFLASLTALDMLLTPGPVVAANVQAGKVTVEGCDYEAAAHHCQIIRALVDAGGLNVTGPQLDTLPGCKGKKFDREIKAIEKEIPAIKRYLIHDGKKGYRIVQKA